MTIPPALEALAGTWSGTNLLWLEPGKPASESETRATVSATAQGQFLTIRYTWANDDQPQDGLILIGQETQPGPVKTVWIDSFHMGSMFMLCLGEFQSDGAVQVKGSYAVPPGPDWGWQIRIEPQANAPVAGGAPDAGGAFRLTMHNITPEGEAFLAVEATYTRKG